MKKSILKVFTVLIIVFCFGFAVNAVEWVEPDNYVVAGVIGASLENARAHITFPVAPGGWYMGGHYKTWVDYISAFQLKDYHWLNYAFGGDVSINGLTHLNDMLTQTLVPGPNGQPVTTVKIVVIGAWLNDFSWLPAYDQQVTDALIQNVNNQIAAAKAAGVEKIIVTGWPKYHDLDLDYMVSLFPELPFHIGEAGFNQVQEEYYNAFSQPNPDYIFVDPWCHYQVIDGAHPGSKTSKQAALTIRKAIKLYDKLVNKKSMFCH